MRMDLPRRLPCNLPNMVVPAQNAEGAQVFQRLALATSVSISRGIERDRRYRNGIEGDGPLGVIGECHDHKNRVISLRAVHGAVQQRPSVGSVIICLTARRPGTYSLVAKVNGNWKTQHSGSSATWESGASVSGATKPLP
jgi:hypothetical protein